MKIINSIIASATPPANSNVMWLDTSSGNPILMVYYRGQWVPIVAPMVNEEE